MNGKTHILYIALISLLTAGCTSTETLVSDTASAAGGAGLGYALSGGNKIATILGASAGVGASKVAQKQISKGICEAYNRGYDEAMSQSVKQQYWIMQNRQKEGLDRSQRKTEVIPVVINEQMVDGEIINERTEYIRVER